MKRNLVFLSACVPDKYGSGLEKRCAMWIHILEKQGYNVDFKNYYTATCNRGILQFLSWLRMPELVANGLHFLFTFSRRKKFIAKALASDSDVFVFRINPLLNFSQKELAKFFKHSTKQFMIDLDECEFALGFSPFGSSWLSRIYKRKIFSTENLVCKSENLIKYVSSEIETAKLNSHYGAQIRNVLVERNKIFPKISAFAEKSLGHPLRLLVLGNYSYYPNEEMLNHLMKYLDTQSFYNQIHFDIVGKGIKEGLKKRLMACDCVTLHGYLSDYELEKLIQNADFHFAPLSSGGGTKLKVIETLAYGLPSVITEKGVEGMLLKANIHYVPFEKDSDLLSLSNISNSEYNLLQENCRNVFFTQYALL